MWLMLSFRFDIITIIKSTSVFNIMPHLFVVCLHDYTHKNIHIYLAGAEDNIFWLVLFLNILE